MIEGGAEKDRPDKNGFRPLQTATEEGHIEVVRFLTEGYSGYDFARCKGQECLGTYRNHAIVEGFLTFSAT